MRLTERDIQILLKLNWCYWLNTTQIRRYFFQGTTLRTINKRLKLLVDEGYIFSHQPSKTEEYFFRLANKGRTILLERTDLDKSDVHVPRKLPTQLKHFATLNDLRWYCDQAILKMRGKLNFFYIDRELKSMFNSSILIPDILLKFSIEQSHLQHRYVFAIEYDAGTENPQYFGRDKVKKYYEAIDGGHPFISNNDLIIIVFADTRKRVVQLIRHSLKFLNKQLRFLFGSLEDLIEHDDLFAEIYIDPQQEFANKKDLMCSIFS